jgi:hypothetical protein
MRDSGCLHCPNLFELDVGVAEVVEEAGALAEQEWDDGDLQLVDQSRGEVLLGHVCAAAERDVLAAGRLLRLLERGFDSVGDEVEGRPALQVGFSSLWLGPATKPSSDIVIFNLSLLTAPPGVLS